MSRLCDRYKYYVKKSKPGNGDSWMKYFYQNSWGLCHWEKHFTKEYNDQSTETPFGSTAWV